MAMSRLSVIVLCLVLLLLPASADSNVLKNIAPGLVSLDLGDGYEMSFQLPDAQAAYDVEVVGPSVSDILKFTRYEIYVYPIGKDDSIANIFLMIYAEPWINPIPKNTRTEPSGIMGPRVEMPQTIDGTRGFVGYDWPAGDPGTDFSKAMWMFFSYYPNAWEEDGSIKSYIKISGESAATEEYPSSLQVTQSIMDSIHTTGPGI